MGTSAISSTVKRLTLESAKYRLGRLAKMTHLGYAYDWTLFCVWCKQMRRKSLPASSKTLSLHITDLLAQGKKVSTAERRAWSVVHYHKLEGLSSPLTADGKAILWGARRLRCEQPRQMRALSLKQLIQVADVLLAEGTPVSIRNRAIFVVGWNSALRRSNLSALNLEDIEIDDRGCTVHVRREKQDQTGRGRWIGLPFAKNPAICPVACLNAWLALRGSGKGPLFVRLNGAEKGQKRAGLRDLMRLSSTTIWVMAKASIKKSGIDPAEYSPHSWRAGFITEAGEAGVSHLIIAAQSGHRSMSTLQRYFRRTDVFKANACSLLGI